MTDIKFLSSLGQRIRLLRLKNNMTQNELASRCNFDKASMSRIESGKTNITIFTLKKISEALATNISQFFKP